PLPADASRWTDEDRGDLAIQVAGELSDDLFVAADALDGPRMERIVSKHARALALTPSAVTSMVKAAFQQSRRFADVFHIDPAKFELSVPEGRAAGLDPGPEAGPAGDVKLTVIDRPDRTRGASAGQPATSLAPVGAAATGPACGPGDAPAPVAGDATAEAPLADDVPPEAPAASADAVPPYLPLLMELSAHVLDRPDFN